jgi:hypothetical protein
MLTGHARKYIHHLSLQCLFVVVRQFGLRELLAEPSKSMTRYWCGRKSVPKFVDITKARKVLKNRILTAANVSGQLFDVPPFFSSRQNVSFPAM